MANIIVTGASRGIGFQLVQELVRDGHEVLALSRNIGPLTSLGLKGLKALSVDLGEERDYGKITDFLTTQWKGVAVLVNNAGSLLNKPFLETDMAEFRAVYEVNVFAVASLTQLVLPFMDKEGHVVNISSMGGVQGSLKFPGLSAYSSSKGALITLTELLAEEFKETGPSFNVLALGAVQTEMLEEAFPGYEAPISALEMAKYIKEFALNGYKMYNGKLLQVSSSTP